MRWTPLKDDRVLSDLAASIGLGNRLAFVAVNGSVEGGTTTFLGCDGSAPVVAFKVARHEHAGRRLRDEAAMLHRLLDTPEPVSSRLPRVLSFRPDLGHGVMAASIVPGRPMPVRMGPNGELDLDAVSADLVRALDWLAALQSATQSTDTEARENTRRRLLAAADEFRGTFPVSRGESAAINAMVDGIDEQLAAGVVAEHGDFCRQNILCDRDGGITGVIDWTFGRETGLPMNDVFFFCTLYFLQARTEPGRAGMVAAFESSMLADEPAAVTVGRVIETHRARLKLSVAAAGQAFAWLLLERAVFDARLFQECRERGAVPRWMLALANESNAAPGDAGGHQFWASLFGALVARRGAAFA